ncbi:hypothetical protein GGI42DRAFT_352519 [Trichoderma sp. SZMC 28013]
MASPYSVPHSRSTLGVKVLQPMLFSPDQRPALDLVPWTQLASSPASAPRPDLNSQGRGLLRRDKKTPRRQQKRRGAARPSPSTRSSNSVRVTSSSSTPTDQASCTGEYLHVSLQGLAGRR